MTAFLNPAAIARLLLGGRQTARDQLLAGKFGAVLRHGRGVYAALAEVERFAGVSFSERQIELALEGRPDRRLELPDPPPEQEGRLNGARIA